MKKVVAYGCYSDVGINTLENLNRYFEIYAKCHEEWQLIKIYAHKGRRDIKNIEFAEMRKNVINGEADIIITKSIVKFGNSIAEAYKIIEELKEKNIEVYFIREDLRTFSKEYEMRLWKSLYSDEESDYIRQEFKKMQREIHGEKIKRAKKMKKLNNNESIVK